MTVWRLLTDYLRFVFVAAAFASILRFLSRAFRRRIFLRCFNFNLRRFMWLRGITDSLPDEYLE